MRLVLLLLVGCGTTIQATMVNPSPHPLRPRPPSTVEMFTSGPPVDRPYVDVAFLEAQQQSEFSADRTPQFFQKLRMRAATMGCDAIVIGAPTNATHVGIDLKTPVNIKGIVATCIVFQATPVERGPALVEPRAEDGAAASSTP